MALHKPRVRSQLAATSELVRLFAKIKTQTLVFQVGDDRFAARNCTNVAIDEVAVSGQITFRRPGGGSDEVYDFTDLLIVKRLRNKKWLVSIKAGSNPAA